MSDEAQTSSTANDFAHEVVLAAEVVSDRYNQTQWARAGKYDVDLWEENFRRPALTAGLTRRRRHAQQRAPGRLRRRHGL